MPKLLPISYALAKNIGFLVGDFCDPDLPFGHGHRGGRRPGAAAVRWRQSSRLDQRRRPVKRPHVRGPVFLNEVFSIFENLRFTESVALQLRGEFYNVMNRVVFGGPAANINNPATFGVIGG